MEERSFHPLDYVSVLRRRMWWFITPLVLCLVIGGLLATFLPRTYKSHAEIGIAAPTLSPELLRGVQSMDRDERQRAISQQLVSRNVLERVVREEKLDPSKPVEEVAARLRSRVVVDVSRPIGRGIETKNGLDSFYLGYLDSTPEQTARIANRLAFVFVEENSKTRIERVENTSEVLAQQLKDSQERLALLESQLRVKKEANMGSLPDQIDANIQVLNGLRQQHESLSNQLRGEQDRLSMIEGQLAAMQQGSAGAMTSSTESAIQRSQNRITGLQQKLAQARTVYTDKHPEITLIQQELADARAELAAARSDTSTRGNEVLLTDPMYRQKTSERDSSRLRIKQLQAAEANARGQIALFQRRVESAPMVEQDLASVKRDVELERTRYMDLKNKHASALLAEDLSRKQGGERFSVLYGAGLPSSPETPDIPRLMIMSLALGLALGAGLVIARELLDRSVHDARALQNEFEIPVLGEIPRIHGAS